MDSVMVDSLWTNINVLQWHLDILGFIIIGLLGLSGLVIKSLYSIERKLRDRRD